MTFTRHAVSGIIIVLCALFITPLYLGAAETGEYIAIRKEGSGKIALVLGKPDAEGKRERVIGLRISMLLYVTVWISRSFSR